MLRIMYQTPNLQGWGQPAKSKVKFVNVTDDEDKLKEETKITDYGWTKKW